MTEIENTGKSSLINQLCTTSGASGEALERLRKRLEGMDEKALRELLANGVKDLDRGVRLEKTGTASNAAEGAYTETFTETNAEGKSIEVVLTFDGENRPLKRVEKLDGNTISTTTYSWHDEDEDTISYVTLNTVKADNTKVVTTALEVNERGSVDKEDFIDRTTVQLDGTETAVYVKDGAIVEQKVKPDGKKVLTAYNGTDIDAYDEKGLHRLFQQTEKDGKINYVEYDGQGNTLTTVQNGESPALIAQKFNVSQNALMRLNKKRGKGSIEQVGSEIRIPGEFNADSYPVRVRKSADESLEAYARYEYNQRAKEIYTSEITTEKLTKDYGGNYWELAKDLLGQNATNDAISKKVQELQLLNGNSKLSKGTTIRTAGKKTDAAYVKELSKYGFAPGEENFGFYSKFNKLTKSEQQNVLNILKYLKTQKITDKTRLKAEIMKIYPDINLFDSDKKIPMRGTGTGAVGFGASNDGVALETFVTEYLGLNLNTEPGKTVYERLSSLPQEGLNQISAGDFLERIGQVPTGKKRTLQNKTFKEAQQVLSRYGIDIRTPQEQTQDRIRYERSPEYAARQRREVAAENITIAYDQAIDLIKQYQDNQGWLNIGYWREKAGALLDLVVPEDSPVATNFDGVIRRLEKQRDFAKSYLAGNAGNPATFKKYFKEFTGKEYDENKVKAFLDKAEKGEDWQNAYIEAFGTKIVDDITGQIDFVSKIDGAGDIVAMLVGTSAIAGTSAFKGAAKGLSTSIGRAAGAKTARIATSMAAGGATLGTWTALQTTTNNLTKETPTTLDDWKNAGVATLESIGFGAAGGLLNTTIVDKVVKATSKAIEKPALKAMKAVKTSLDKSGTMSGADLMKTFIKESAPGTISKQASLISNLAAGTVKAAGFTTEVAGFTLYETALDVCKDLFNAEGRLPEDMTVENLAAYLGDRLKDQVTMLGEIKGISSLLMMMKGGRVGAQLEFERQLEQCNTLKNVKIKTATVNGREVYEITYPNGNRAVANSLNDVVANCNMIMNFDMISNLAGAKTQAQTDNKTAKNSPNGMTDAENAALNAAKGENPANVAAEKIKSEVMRREGDGGMRLNTPESLDAELRFAEENPNAPKENLETLSLVVNGKLNETLTARYEKMEDAFREIAQNRRAEINELKEKYANDNQKFAQEVVKLLADDLGFKGLSVPVKFVETKSADGFANWPEGRIDISNKLTNKDKIVNILSHELVHMIQFRDIAAQYGADGVKALIENDPQIKAADKEGLVQKALNNEFNKQLIEQFNDVAETGSLTEYLRSIYKNEFINTKSANDPEYTSQLTEREAYRMGSRQLGDNMAADAAKTRLEAIRARLKSGGNLNEVMEGERAADMDVKGKENITVNEFGEVSRENSAKNLPAGSIWEAYDLTNEQLKVRDLFTDELLFSEDTVKAEETVRSIIKAVSKEDGSLDAKVYSMLKVIYNSKYFKEDNKLDGISSLFEMTKINGKVDYNLLMKTLSKDNGLENFVDGVIPRNQHDTYGFELSMQNIKTCLRDKSGKISIENFEKYIELANSNLFYNGSPSGIENFFEKFQDADGTVNFKVMDTFLKDQARRLNNNIAPDKEVTSKDYIPELGQQIQYGFGNTALLLKYGRDNNGNLNIEKINNLREFIENTSYLGNILQTLSSASVKDGKFNYEVFNQLLNVTQKLANPGNINGILYYFRSGNNDRISFDNFLKNPDETIDVINLIDNCYTITSAGLNIPVTKTQAEAVKFLYNTVKDSYKDAYSILPIADAANEYNLPVIKRLAEELMSGKPLTKKDGTPYTGGDYIIYYDLINLAKKCDSKEAADYALKCINEKDYFNKNEDSIYLSNIGLLLDCYKNNPEFTLKYKSLVLQCGPYATQTLSVFMNGGEISGQQCKPLNEYQIDFVSKMLQNQDSGFYSSSLNAKMNNIIAEQPKEILDLIYKIKVNKTYTGPLEDFIQNLAKVKTDAPNTYELIDYCINNGVKLGMSRSELECRNISAEELANVKEYLNNPNSCLKNGNEIQLSLLIDNLDRIKFFDAHPDIVSIIKDDLSMYIEETSIPLEAFTKGKVLFDMISPDVIKKLDSKTPMLFQYAVAAEYGLLTREQYKNIVDALNVSNKYGESAVNTIYEAISGRITEDLSAEVTSSQNIDYIAKACSEGRISADLVKDLVWTRGYDIAKNDAAVQQLLAEKAEVLKGIKLKTQNTLPDFTNKVQDFMESAEFNKILTASNLTKQEFIDNMYQIAKLYSSVQKKPQDYINGDFSQNAYELYNLSLSPENKGLSFTEIVNKYNQQGRNYSDNDARNAEWITNDIKKNIEQNLPKIYSALAATDMEAVKLLLDKRFDKFSESLNTLAKMPVDARIALADIIRNGKRINKKGQPDKLTGHQKIDLIQIVDQLSRITGAAGVNVDYKKYMTPLPKGAFVLDIDAMRGDIFRYLLKSNGLSEAEIASLKTENLNWDKEYVSLLTQKPAQDNGELSEVIVEASKGNFANYITDTTNKHGQANAETAKMFGERGLNYEAWQTGPAEQTFKIGDKDYTIKLWNRVPQESLFDGSYTTCCTALDGSNGGSMANYLLNTAINVVEVKDSNGKTVAMSRCYVGEVGGKNTLVMENIEANNRLIKEMYGFGGNMELTAGIFDYMKDFATLIGGKDMPVVMSTSYNKIGTDPFNNLATVTLPNNLIGKISKPKIYLNTYCGYIDANNLNGKKADFYIVRGEYDQNN